MKYHLDKLREQIQPSIVKLFGEPADRSSIMAAKYPKSIHMDM